MFLPAKKIKTKAIMDREKGIKAVRKMVWNLPLPIIPDQLIKTTIFC